MILLVGFAGLALVALHGLYSSYSTTWEVADKSSEPRDRDVIDGATLKPLGGRDSVTADDDTVRFFGRVVGADDQAVAQAEVTAKVDGKVVQSLHTDAEGHFAFRASVPEATDRFRAGIVIVKGPSGAVGHASLPLSAPPSQFAKAMGGERRVGRILLRDALSCAVEIASSCEQGFPATVWVLPSAFATDEPLLVDQTDAHGRLTLHGLSPGVWRLVAGARGCGRVTRTVTLPLQDPGPVSLALPEARTLTVRVQEQGTEHPVSDASVQIKESLRLTNWARDVPLVTVSSSVVTDERGVAVIDGLGATEHLVLRASASGFPVSAVAHVNGDETSATIQLVPPRTIRWPIVDGGHGLPPDGTSVALRETFHRQGRQCPSSGVVEDGHVVAAHWPPGAASAFAHASGFGTARLLAGKGATTGAPASFFPTRRIELFAKDDRGQPMQGLTLHVLHEHMRVPSVPTDAQGYAVAEDLYGGPHASAKVLVSKHEAGARTMLGRVDLAKMDGRFEHVVPVPRTLRCRVFVDDLPAPDGLVVFLRVGRRELDGVVKGGRLEVTWEPSDLSNEVDVHAHASGTAGSWVRLALDAPNPPEVVLRLRAAGEALVRVHRPADGRVRALLQVWDEAKGAWPPLPAKASGHRVGHVDESGFVSFRRLAPGRYRVVDLHSRRDTGPFEVRGNEQTRVTLDLRAVGWVKGRVVTPPGVPAWEFTVGFEGEPVRETPLGLAGDGLPGERVRSDGTFAVRVPGDRTAVLRPFHHVHRPHPTQGRVEVSTPREGIQLVAVRGATATVRFSQPVVRGRDPARVVVRLFPGEPKGQGLDVRGLVNPASDALTFGGYDPGTYTVWIDMVKAAPLVLRDVALGEDDVDLGRFDPDPGSRVVVEVLVKDGQSPPRTSMIARRLDEPAYTRSIVSSESRVTLSGLGPGRFQVISQHLNEEITVDGTTDVHRTLDLR